MKKLSNVLWGVVLIGLGVIFGLNALEITDINIFFDGWWTLFIIVPSFISLFTDNDRTGDIIGIVIGVFLLLACQDIVDFELIFKLMVPAVLVIIGVSLLFKDSIKSKIKSEVKKLNKTSKDNKEYYATFGKQDINLSKEDINGSQLSAIFGGIECDLKDAKLDGDCVINASSIFGGITIYIPEDVNVVVVSTSIFGGVSDDRKNKNKDSKATLYINATCIFGGVEVR